MTSAYELMMGQPKVRRTWKQTLSVEKNAARVEQMRFCKAVRRALGDGYEVTFYFNPGGTAVMGETWVKIHTAERTSEGLVIKDPIVEACLSVDFSYMRQWDGRHSGHNHRITYSPSVDMGRRGLNRVLAAEVVVIFAALVRTLAGRPFVRF